MPIGEESGFRHRVRQLEWQLPMPLQRLFFASAGKRFNPYTPWNRTSGAIFVHVPRTAGTSIAQALGQPTPHVPITRYLIFDRQAFDTSFKFAFVRNPWDRLLSSYAIMRKELEALEWPVGVAWARLTVGPYDDFESFVLALDRIAFRKHILRHPHFRSQLDWISLPGSGEVPLDFIGRFERLEQDFEKVKTRLGITASLPAVNASDHQPYREAYSRKMRDIVADVYSRSVKTFGYRF
jgi:hypothetical protein